MDFVTLAPAIFAGIAQAYGLENVPQWKALPPLGKKAIVAVASVLVPLGVEYIQSIGAGGPTLETGAAHLVINSVVAWVVSQITHGVNPLKGK